MATKSRDNTSTNAGKKEKVVTPSNPQTKTSSTKPIGSSAHKASPSSQASTEKQVPNYLKPTISSRLESPTGPKPTLNRRRSFDNKPPSLSRAPTKATLPERVAQPGRSSSSSSSAKSASSRTVRGTGTKPQTLYAKSGKKGTGESFAKKEGPSGRGDHKSCPKDSVSREVQGSEVVDHHDDDHDRVVQVAPEQDELKSEDHDHDDHGVVEDELDHDHDHDQDHDEVKDNINDISTVSEELVVKSEDDHDHDHQSNNAGIEESIIDHEKVESNEVEEEKTEDHSEPNGTSNESTDIASTIEANVEEELVKEEDVKEESEDKLETNKTNNDDENGDQVNGKELGEDNNDDQEAKSEPNKAQSGKKESQIAYNDVIEETASKLLEKRKNKVKALVGAFETVIDYESK